MDAWVLSVGQLNEYVRRTLAADPILKRVKLRGEISNFKRHTSGHLYFSLKDDEARIACVMFRSSVATLRMQPADGMRVVLTGQVSVYVRDGQYQFYADGMREDGVGDLFLRFEALKRRLEDEGLFDASRKRPLPLLPRIVGVVTSPTGAVIRDIVQVATRRNPGVQILLCPARVQGEGAAQEIVRSLTALTRIPQVDVIIVGRGGGSMEELWAFNEEIVARAIVACPVPVVSAVGHETDFTIADFVADLRAPTPSAAAELTVPHIRELNSALNAQHRQLQSAMDRCLLGAKTRLRHAELRLLARHPKRVCQAEAQRLLHLRQRLLWLATSQLQTRSAQVAQLHERLRTLSPTSVLARGYAYVTMQGRPILSATGLTKDQPFCLRMGDGTVDARVSQVHLDPVREE